MSDGLLGSILITAGFTIAIIIVLLRERKKNTRTPKILLALYVVWMVFWIVYAVSHFMKLT